MGNFEQPTRSKRRKARRALDRVRGKIQNVPGPSSNPATNLLIADVAVRGASMIVRRGMEQGLLRARFDPEKARDIVQGRTLGRTLISAAVARVATRSVPGLLLVGGGLLAKAAFERGSHRRSQRKGDTLLSEMAENGSDD